MAHSALAASSMFTTTSTLFHGHTIAMIAAMIHANISTLDGAEIIESLPWYLRLAFPAILSQKGGLSRSVMIQLRVGNQHKMWPRGIRALLIEMHTMRFNVLQLDNFSIRKQFLNDFQAESWEGRPSPHCIHICWQRCLILEILGINIATLALFGLTAISPKWWIKLLNKMKEMQISILLVSQLISYQLMTHIRYFSRVCRVFVDFIANSTGRLTSILQKLMVFLYLVHYGHAWTGRARRVGALRVVGGLLWFTSFSIPLLYRHVFLSHLPLLFTHTCLL